MRRATILGVWAICAALAAACGDNRTAAARPQPVDVRGCLTASGDQFVLTQLQDASAAATPTTETFMLTNAAVQNIDLKQYVGQEVHVAGEADPPRVAEVRERDAATPTGTSGQAKVRTQEETRFASRKLAVSSITPTGNPCPVATPGTPTPQAR